MTHPLDNPVWNSLSQSHRHLAIDYGSIKFYHPDYCPFGGFEGNRSVSNHIDHYAALTDNFFVVGERPLVSTQLKIKQELICLQMVGGDNIQVKAKDPIAQLTNENREALLQLVNLVQPGYFKTKTFLLGNYFGIFKNGQLIAVSGERMKMDDFVEVSAIVTHPQHTGKGYASQLIAHTVNNILTQKKTPYLHVVENNFGAITLYEKLRFKTRKKMSFWNIAK